MYFFFTEFSFKMYFYSDVPFSLMIFISLIQFQLISSSLNFNQRNSRSNGILTPSGLDIEDLEDTPLLEMDNTLANYNIRELRETDDIGDESDDESKLRDELKIRYKEWKERNQKIFQLMNEESEMPLRRISYTSKYLWDQQNQTLKTYKELKEQCEKYNLDMVEIRDQADFLSLANFLLINQQITIGLGVSDVASEGKFVEPDGVTPIGFQMFSNGEPNNGQGVPENCVTITLSTEQEIVMYDVNCNSINSHFVCQRQNNSIVYEDSAERVAMTEDALEMIGDAGTRRYYIGSLQKTWDAAKSYCEENNKHLLELGDNERTTHQELYKFVMTWRNQQGLHYPTGFWTSGQFSNAPNEPSFTWQTSSGIFNLADKSIPWQWAKEEPRDQTGKGYEKCIDISFPALITPQTVSTTFRASNCYLPFYYICYEEMPENRDCRENGPLLRTGLNSKFLYLETSEPVTHESAKDTCEKWDYIMADLQNLADVQHLIKFVQEKKLEKRTWHLGLNDIDMEGEFYETDRSTRVQFHAFAVSQPDNKENEDCVVLVHDNTTLVMEDRNCETNTAHVLCQFQKETACFINSAQNQQKISEQLMFFGETAIRRYFLSKTQKTWVDAMEYCSSRKKKLLDLHFIQELNHFKRQLFYPKLIAWAMKYNSGVWTSGRFIRSVNDGRFRWETSLTGEMFPEESNPINFRWSDGEPSDSTSRNMEVCVELSVSEWAKSKQGDRLIPVLKATNCLLPNYFICFEDAPHLKNCHLPPKIESGFKSLSETSPYIYVDSPKKLNATERKATCQQWGLDVAEISDLRDYYLVSNALDSWNATGMYFGLGINSVGSEGLWSEADGVTPIKFQSFGNNEPQYYGNNEPLDHVVFNKHKSPSWQMTTISSRRFTSLLCQFKRDSECQFQNIFTYLDRNSEKNYLKRLQYEDGKVPDSETKYFIGDSQQKWEDAMRFCWSRNTKLLDLGNGTEAQNIYKLLVAFIKKKKLHPFVIRFWTSGKYVESFNDKQFRWETVPTFARHADVEKELNVKMIGPPVSTAQNDKCLTLGLDSLEPVGGTITATLKASNCFLPYFFICYEEKLPSPPERAPVAKPTPELKYNKIPSCKEPTDPKKQKQQEAMKTWMKSLRPPSFYICDEDKI